jgi:signal transduction histidine kinase
MRQLLGALRPEVSEARYAPQPGIADIPTLIRTTENVGGRVTYSNEVDPGSESTLIELTVYRIVQEALSNVVRHAPRADTTVALGRTSSGIVVRVTNDAAPAPSAPFPTDPGVDDSVDVRVPVVSSIDSGGHGLRGMRERVAILGGTIVQEPLPTGGFLIEAAIPTAAPTEKETP